MALIRGGYPDFGRTLPADKLVERDGIRASSESLRKGMMAVSLRQTCTHWRRAHRPCLRRKALGEPIQIDSRERRRFEDRAPPCTLWVFIDDATEALMQLLFMRSDSTKGPIAVLAYCRKEHGRPVAFHSDKCGLSRVNKKEAQGRHGVTQFGHALRELNTAALCANSS